MAPVPIEDRIKSTLKGIASNVVVVGDRKKFLSTLLTLRVNVDPATLQPTNQLTDEVHSSLLAPFSIHSPLIPPSIEDSCNSFYSIESFPESEGYIQGLFKSRFCVHVL